MSVTWKPVPKMIVSTSRSLPSRGDDRRAADLARSPSVTTSTFGCVQRRVVVVGEQDALAAEAVAPASACARSSGSATCAAQVLRGDAARRVDAMRGFIAKPSTNSSRGPVDAAAHEPAGASGNARYSASLRARDRAVASAGTIHGGVRWKTCSCPTLRLDLRDELDRRRAGADDRDALAVERRGRGPSARSGRSCPRSVSRPGSRGSRLGSAARSPATSSVGREARRARSRRASGWPRSSQRAAGHLVAEADVRADAVALGAARAGTPRSPAGGEYVRLQSGLGANENEYRCDGHVARAAGIGVVAPRAADVARRARARRSRRSLPA